MYSHVTTLPLTALTWDLCINFQKHHTHISYSQYFHNVLVCDSKSQCSHMWVHWLLLDSLVFTPILWSMYSHVPSKSQCTHMWVHWLKNCAITFNLHDKLFYSFAIVVVFSNVYLVEINLILHPFIGNLKTYIA